MRARIQLLIATVGLLVLQPLAAKAQTGQGFCVLPSGLTRAAASETDCVGNEKFVNFVGEQGPQGAAGEDGSSCSVTQADGSATIDCTDGTSATVSDGADGAEGPPGPAGPEGPPGDTALLCSVLTLNNLIPPAGLDCPVETGCPCFTEQDLLASGATACESVTQIFGPGSGAHSLYTVGGSELYSTGGESDGTRSTSSCYGSNTISGAISQATAGICAQLIEDTLGPCPEVSPQ